MLTITVGATEHYDEKKNKFVQVGGADIQLEHSLVSLSKWESSFEKPFLGGGAKTPEEVFGYVEAMITTSDIPPGLSKLLTRDNLAAINEYVEAKMTASWVNDLPGKQAQETITSELIYYWMTVFKIAPDPCERWHLNRLFMLIKIASHKSSKPEKMSASQRAAHNQAENARRRAQMGTSG